MTLDEYGQELQARNIILQRRGAGLGLWAPNTEIPIELEAATWRHKQRLLRLYAQSDVRLCPSRDLHRQYYRYAGRGRFVCSACEMLEKEVKRL